MAVGLLPMAASANTLDSSYITPDGRELGLIFPGADGLSGQAVFRLLPGDQSIEIVVTNASTAVPGDPCFDNPSDQILTSLYFDLGGAGLGDGDPCLTGGQAFVADGSVGVGKKNTLQGGDEMSNQWGYGNFKYTEEPMAFLPPNFVTAMGAHAAPFSPGKLKGPNYGAISALDLAGGHNAGLAAISDSVRVVVALDAPVSSLEGLVSGGNYTPAIEFGSDHEFLVFDDFPGSEVPPGEIPESLTMVGVLLAVSVLTRYLRKRTRGFDPAR